MTKILSAELIGFTKKEVYIFGGSGGVDLGGGAEFCMTDQVHCSFLLQFIFYAEISVCVSARVWGMLAVGIKSVLIQKWVKQSITKISVVISFTFGRSAKIIPGH